MAGNRVGVSMLRPPPLRPGQAVDNELLVEPRSNIYRINNGIRPLPHYPHDCLVWFAYLIWNRFCTGWRSPCSHSLLYSSRLGTGMSSFIITSLCAVDTALLRTEPKQHMACQSRSGRGRIIFEMFLSDCYSPDAFLNPN